MNNEIRVAGTEIPEGAEVVSGVSNSPPPQNPHEDWEIENNLYPEGYTDHYVQPAYLGKNDIRLLSYRHLENEVLKSSRNASVLIVGKGDGIIGKVLTAWGYNVTTLDIDKHLYPDIVADISAPQTHDEKFDVVMCCQVLEHLPLSEVRHAMTSLHHYAKGRIIISIPDQRRFKWGMTLPRFRRIPLGNHFEEMGHHWEVGADGLSLREVLKSIDPTRRAKLNRVRGFEWHLFITMEA